MDINLFAATNLERAKRWHDGDISTWSALEWAGAACGEAGEMANAAKKVKRMEQAMPSITDAVPDDLAKMRAKVAKEAADTIIYSLLTMSRVGVTDHFAVLQDVFNKKSEEYNFPERV